MLSGRSPVTASAFLEGGVRRARPRARRNQPRRFVAGPASRPAARASAFVKSDHSSPRRASSTLFRELSASEAAVQAFSNVSISSASVTYSKASPARSGRSSRRPVRTQRSSSRSSGLGWSGYSAAIWRVNASALPQAPFSRKPCNAPRRQVRILPFSPRAFHRAAKVRHASAWVAPSAAAFCR